MGGALDQPDQQGDSEQDARAIHADWCAVGDDLYNAMARCR